MPDVPTPLVKGQLFGGAAAHASRSISSFAPAARTLGSFALTAIDGSFCLFCVNGDVGLPTEMRTSLPLVAPAMPTAEPAANSVAANIQRNLLMSPFLLPIAVRREA